MITIRNITNPFKPEESEVRELRYSRNKTLAEVLAESGFEHKDKRVIVSGRREHDLSARLENGDEIIIIPEVEAPVVAVVSAIISAVWAVAVAHPFLFTFFVLSLGYSIYQYMNQPRMPDFNLGMSGLDEGSPTYGWDGIQTIQEVGVPVAVVYGEHKVGGNIINQFLWADGDKNYLNVLLALCEGEIEDIGQIYINDNPLENFTGVEIIKRFGTNDQALIDNFEDLHNLYPVNANLTQNNPYIYTTIDSDVEAFEIHLRLNNGLYQQAGGGGISSWSVTYRVEYKAHTSGTWIDLGEHTISGQSRTTLRRVFRKDGLAPDKYDIRVTRVSEDSSLDPLKVGDLMWFETDEIKTDDLKYPNTALLGLKLLATDQLSGSMPNITTIVKGKKISVPKVMSGTEEVGWEDYYWDGSDYRLLSDDTLLSWDGATFVERYCANPVWCLKDLLLNTRYGLGEFIQNVNLDDALLLEMSRYCEERLTDGNGGYEKRFRMDVVIDSNTKALDLLIQLCATFNAMPVYSAGGISFKIDKEAQPTQLFGMGNIIRDSFAQSWKTLKEIPNVIEIQFMDKDKGYRQETISYIDEEALAAGDPMRKSQLRLFTTGTSYAIRAGRYALKVARYVNRSVTFKAGIDAVACQAGDIISISHDVPQWGISGRVKAGSTATLVKLDKSVVLEEGKSYRIQVRFADDTIEEQAVTSPAGEHIEITCESFSQSPQAYDVFALGETNKIKKDFRVVSIQREGKHEARISALEYNPNVYDDSDIILPTSNFSMLSTEIPKVENLTLTERLVKKPDGTIENSIDVWFDKPPLADQYVKTYARAKIYISDNDGASWQVRGETAGDHFQVIGDIIEGVTYKVRVVSVSDLGQEAVLSAAPESEITILGKTAPPSDVTGFAAAFATDHIEFTWNEVLDVDLWGYEIRELPFSGASWGLGTVVVTKTSGRSYSHFSFSTGLKNYAIKAIDTSNNYSEGMAVTSILISSIPQINVIRTEIMDFLRQGSISGDVEVCYTKDLTNEYYAPAVCFRSDVLWDVGNWDDGGFWDKNFDTGSTGSYTTPVTDLGASKEVGITLELGLANVQGGNLLIEIAYSDIDPDPSNWGNFASGNFTARYFKFRFTLSTNNAEYGVNLYKVKALFDVPDRTQTLLDQAVADSGWTVINLDGFTQVKGLIVSVSGGAYVVETDEAGLPASFNVRLKDPAASMAQVAGAVNVLAVGY